MLTLFTERALTLAKDANNQFAAEDQNIANDVMNTAASIRYNMEHIRDIATFLNTTRNNPVKTRYFNFDEDGECEEVTEEEYHGDKGFEEIPY